VRSFIGGFRLFGCREGLRDDACQNAETFGACFGVELKASRLLRRRKKFENGQGQLHGNSPHRRPDAAPQRMIFNLRTLLPTLGGSLNASSVTFSLRFAARIDSSGSTPIRVKNSRSYIS